MNLTDDDPTPPHPPVHPANLALLAALSDLVLLAHDHRDRLRELTAELRFLPTPAGGEFRTKLAEAMRGYHAPALAIAERLLTADKGPSP